MWNQSILALLFLAVATLAQKEKVTFVLATFYIYPFATMVAVQVINQFVFAPVINNGLFNCCDWPMQYAIMQKHLVIR